MCKLINRESNILLLDEPTNHLDVDAKDELKRALMTYKGSVLMVCHEPDFYEEWATDIWDVSKWTTKIRYVKIKRAIHRGSPFIKILKYVIYQFIQF